jgi:hypothetical protein
MLEDTQRHILHGWVAVLHPLSKTGKEEVPSPSSNGTNHCVALLTRFNQAFTCGLFHDFGDALFFLEFVQM